jgi:multidrug resistance efflux pump
MSRKRILLFAVISLVPLVAALWIAGFDPNYLLGNDVTTNTGYITGDMIQASAPAGGQVTQIAANVGDPVTPGQTVAVLVVPPQAGRQLPFVPQVRAPAPGTVVHLSVLVGQTVTTGQTVATIADLHKLWVIAPVDEGSYSSVRLDQPADVYVPALNQTFAGRVTQLDPDLQAATPRTAGAAPTGGSGAPTAANGIPVRVDFDYGDALMYPGMTANVTIYTRR